MANKADHKIITFDHDFNLLSANCKIEGTLRLADYSNFNGEIKGKIIAAKGSTLIISEQGCVEGSIQGDIVIVDGFVHGEIHAETKIIISETGRVLGSVQSPVFSILFGGYFEGQCTMDEEITGDEVTV